MLRIILHGDNHVLTRQRLTDLIEQAKQQGIKDIITLDGKKLTALDLRQAVTPQSLFGTDKLIIIEGLLSRPHSKEKDQLLSLISQKDTLLRTDLKKSILVLWEPKEIAKTTFSKLKSFKVELFKTPAIIFKLLDSLKPGNAKNTLTLLQHSNNQNPPELVFYMLSRRVSELIIAHDPKAGTLLKSAPWQKSRLVSQAHKFSFNQLLNLHSQLLHLDEAIKTGESVLPLASHLDLLLAKL